MSFSSIWITLLKVPVFSVPEPVFVFKVCTVICDLCGAKAANPQELSAHKWLVHSAKSTVRMKLGTTHCLFCLLDFHTRTKIHDHVAYRSPKCRSFYDLHIVAIDNDLYESLEVFESVRVKALVATGKRKNWHPVPTCRIPGPRLLAVP